jgi:hypothetical protein
MSLSDPFAHLSEESCEEHLSVIYSKCGKNFQISQQRLSKREQLRQINTIVQRTCERKKIELPDTNSPAYFEFCGETLKELFYKK